MARFLLETAVLISALYLVGCGKARCAFKYDMSDGTQYSVCSNDDGTTTTTRMDVVIRRSK